MVSPLRINVTCGLTVAVDSAPLPAPPRPPAAEDAVALAESLESASAVTRPDEVVEMPTERACNVVVTEPPISALASATPTPAPGGAATPDAVALRGRLDRGATVRRPGGGSGAVRMVAEGAGAAAFCAVILAETAMEPSLALSVALALLALDVALEEPEFLPFEAEVVLVAEVPSLPPTDRLLPAKLVTLPEESEVLSSSVALPFGSTPLPLE